MTVNKKLVVFTCKEESYDKDGNIVIGEEKEYCVRKPNAKQLRDGQKVYNRAFSEAISSGCILRSKLEDFMRRQNLWDDEKQAELTSLNKEIISIEHQLTAGGIEFDQAVAIAKKNRRLRTQLRNLLSARTDLDSNTAEGQADNERFNYYVSVCLVYNNTQQPVFKSLDEYVENASTEQAVTGATKLAQMIYDISDDFESRFPENKFFREFGLTDDKNRFIDEQGRLVSPDGKLIDEEGNYITEGGDICDPEGNLLDKDGNYLVERKPFLRNGQPVETKTPVVAVEQE